MLPKQMESAPPFAGKDKGTTFLILFIAFFASGMGLLFLGGAIQNQFLVSMGHIVAISGGLWMICRRYVQFLWHYYPWSSRPGIHTVLEVSGIGILTFTYGYFLYQFERFLGLQVHMESPAMEVEITLLITYLITGIHEMIYFYKQWKHNFSKSVRLERDNIQARYESLKAQINPHFLFNSLNSLTSMVDDNPEAVSHIENLSEFLRYMLAGRNKDLAYLEDEIRILNHFIDLQKSRFRDNLKVTIEVPEKYNHYALPTLALQMLVENCVKHNIISREKPLHITVEAKNETLEVINALQPKKDVDSTGQGLRNIMERYRYFTPKTVKITETDREFRVSIPLLILEE